MTNNSIKICKSKKTILYVFNSLTVLFTSLLSLSTLNIFFKLVTLFSIVKCVYFRWQRTQKTSPSRRLLQQNRQVASLCDYSDYTNLRLFHFYINIISEFVPWELTLPKKQAYPGPTVAAQCFICLEYKKKRKPSPNRTLPVRE